MSNFIGVPNPDSDGFQDFSPKAVAQRLFTERQGLPPESLYPGARFRLEEELLTICQRVRVAPDDDSLLDQIVVKFSRDGKPKDFAVSVAGSAGIVVETIFPPSFESEESLHAPCYLVDADGKRYHSAEDAVAFARHRVITEYEPDECGTLAFLFTRGREAPPILINADCYILSGLRPTAYERAFQSDPELYPHHILTDEEAHNLMTQISRSPVYAFMDDELVRTSDSDDESGGL
jgi:hypothetical protein